MQFNVWVIMTKDRKWIAKGSTRNRYLVKVSDIKDKKRISLWGSEKSAKSAFKTSWFYGGPPTYNMSNTTKWNLVEAVPCILIIEDNI